MNVLLLFDAMLPFCDSDRWREGLPGTKKQPVTDGLPGQEMFHVALLSLSMLNSSRIR
jgi:hypothetical protein